MNNQDDNRAAGGRKDLPLKEDGTRHHANSSYDPSYCKILLDEMSKGASIYEVAAKIGKSVKTLQNWKKRHPEWAEACEKGHDWSRGWFHKQQRDNMIIIEEKEGPRTKFDTRSYIHTMAVRFNEREKEPPMTIQMGDNADNIEKVFELAKKYHEDEF